MANRDLSRDRPPVAQWEIRLDTPTRVKVSIGSMHRQSATDSATIRFVMLWVTMMVVWLYLLICDKTAFEEFIAAEMKEMEVTDLDVGSPEEIDLKSRSSNPKPFTIESLIGKDHREDDEEKSREDIRQRDFFYQQHCLATAAGALPGLESYSVFEIVNF